MSLNDVTEGTLPIRTNQAGRYYAGPAFKERRADRLTGIIAARDGRQESRTRARRKATGWKAIYVFPLPETPPWTIYA